MSESSAQIPAVTVEISNEVYDRIERATAITEELDIRSAGNLESLLGEIPNQISFFENDLIDDREPESTVDVKELTETFARVRRTEANQFPQNFEMEVGYVRQIFLDHPAILESLQPHYDFGIPARETMAKLQRELDDSTERFELLQEECATSREAISHLTQQLDQLRHTSIADQNSLMTLTNERALVEQELNSLRADKGRLESDISEIMRTKAELSERCAALETVGNRQNSLLDQLKGLFDQLHEANDVVSSLKEAGKILSDEKAGLQAQNQELVDRVDRLELEKEQLHTENAAIKLDMEQANDNFQSQLNRRDRDARQLLRDYELDHDTFQERIGGLSQQLQLSQVNEARLLAEVEEKTNLIREKETLESSNEHVVQDMNRVLWSLELPRKQVVREHHAISQSISLAEALVKDTVEFVRVQRTENEQLEETKAKLTADIDTIESRNNNLQRTIERSNAESEQLRRQFDSEKAEAKFHYDKGQEALQARLDQSEIDNEALLRERDELATIEQERRPSLHQLSQDHAELSARLDQEREKLRLEEEKTQSQERIVDAYRQWYSIWLTETGISQVLSIEQDLEDTVALSRRLAIRDAAKREMSTVLGLFARTTPSPDLEDQVCTVLMDPSQLTASKILDIHTEFEFADPRQRRFAIALLYVILQKKLTQYATDHTFDTSLCILVGLELISLWLDNNQQPELLAHLQTIAPSVANSNDVLLQAIFATVRACISGNPEVNLYESLKNIPHPRLQSQGFTYVQYGANILVLTPNLQVVHSLLQHFSVETRLLGVVGGHMSLKLVFKDDPILQSFESGRWNHFDILYDIDVLASAFLKNRDSMVQELIL